MIYDKKGKTFLSNLPKIFFMKALFTFLLIFPVAFGAHATPAFFENAGQVRDQGGQARPDVQFVFSAPGFSFFIGPGKMIWQFTKVNARGGAVIYHRVEATFLNANTKALYSTGSPMQAIKHYYLPGLGRGGAHARSFDKITYHDLYPDIDWEVYLNEAGQLEYDLVLAPGARLADVQLHFEGMDGLSLGSEGLMIKTSLGEVQQALPLAFAAGQPVPCRYELKDNLLSFAATTPKAKGWRIDPVLQWASYYGGTGSEEMQNIGKNRQGDPILSGVTFSEDHIATGGAYMDTFPGDYTSGYLAQFTKDGSLLWATYIGGTTQNWVWDAQGDRFGNIYVAGASSNLPGTPGTYQPWSPSVKTPFLAKFTADGHFIWLTYYGNGGGAALAVTCLPDGSVCIAGNTEAPEGIASPGAYQMLPGGGIDGFVARMDSSGNRIWGTYYGGPLQDLLSSICADEESNIYTSGSTFSASGIASPGSFSNSLHGSMDACLAAFRADGQLKWATYFGGDGGEDALGVAAKQGKVYLTGATNSPGLATPGVHQTSLGGAMDMFLTAFDTSGARLWCTYWGGEGTDYSNQVRRGVVLSGGDIFIATETNSTTGIATPDAYQPALAGAQDGALGRFSTEGQLIWSTYYGGPQIEAGMNLAANDSGHVFFCGRTFSTAGIATPGSYQSINLGSADHFVGCFYENPELGISLWPFAGQKAIFQLSPNPVQQKAMLSGSAVPGSFPLKIAVTDAAGRLLWQDELAAPADLPRAYDFARLPAGIYFLQITGRDLSQGLKVVK